MKYLFFLLFSFQANHLLGQSSLSIGPELGVASNFSKSSKLGIGGSLEYVNKFSKGAGFRFLAGYTSFKGRVYDTRVSFLPVRLGLQGFLAETVFLFGDVGIANYRDNNSTKQTGFSFGAGGGYRIPFAMSNRFVQLSAYYNFFRFNENLTYTWFNFRAASGLNFGRSRTTEK